MTREHVDICLKSAIVDERIPSLLNGQFENAVKDVDIATHDKALALLNGPDVVFDINSSEAKRVLRKIDHRIMPLVLTIYTLMLVDKNSLSFANIMNIKEDTHLTESQYSWLGSIVYFGYLAGEIPVTFLMQRVPLAKFFAVMVILWGMVEMCHAACNNFGSLLAVRFLLGMIEVSAAPVIIYILGSWYTKAEQVSRVAIWYTSSGMGNVVGGFFAWIIWHVAKFRWQALFLYEGGLTVCLGVVLWFVLAASPTDAAWLSEEEKIIALERVRENKTGTEVWKFNKSQLIECFCDIRFYLVFLILVSIGLPNGGITVFGPSIISALGFDVQQTTLLSMAPGVAAVLGTFAALGVAKFTNRTIGALFTLLLSCIGVVMMLRIDPAHYVARYGGYILTMQFPICILFLITFMTAGVGGSTKKLAFGASYQLGYTVGNIVGPQTYRASDAPNYPIAKYTMVSFLIFSLFLFAVYGLIHKWWNIQRDKQDALDVQNGIIHESVKNEEFTDLTDFKQKSLRYPE